MDSSISCQQEKFKMILEELNISQRELSRRTGIRRTSISEWFKIGTTPKLTPEQTLALLNEIILSKYPKKKANTVREAMKELIELFPGQQENSGQNQN
jgi:transcriptional regulator with XRE-family HTH domain